MINGLDLFSGIGGISIALKPWVRTIAYCESDKYAQNVLLSRMRSNSIDIAPIWDDVRTLQFKHIDLPVDIISGGFPCQDISVAGNGVGLDGERSRLFFEITRLASEFRPKFVFLENVPAITIRGLDRVLLEFTSMGYDCRWTIVSAKEVGACHKRERWFLLAHPNSGGSGYEWEKIQQKNKEVGKRKTDAFDNGKKIYDPHPFIKRLEGQNRNEQKLCEPSRYGEWSVEPTICRANNGVSNRMDRIRCLGNSVVPKQAREAFIKLLTLKGH